MAFATMLLASLRGSNTEFLAEELEAEQHCYIVWNQIRDEQVSPTVTVDETLEYWSELLLNKVTLYQDFPRYYSSF